MAARKNVPASTVRDWYAGLSTPPADVPAPGSRGRLHPTTIAAFHKANPRMRYETGVAETPVREFRHRATDKNGRTRWANRSLTLAEARALIGDTGKGRLNTDAVVAALEAEAGFVAKPEASTPKPVASEVAKPEASTPKE